ncbi:hypothetical protein VaNZ11_015465 [Volvox africanus]|uniref:Uncharacterized protein n=1 Tax=Volvox africanus TaxID=51714 RepID=A0ABQ5SKN3_9CHLO|nr:hypothetical protein VaNZ11_015465 [Volvox africanus]
MCLCSAPVRIARNLAAPEAGEGSGYPAGSCPPPGHPHQLGTHSCWVPPSEGSMPPYSRKSLIHDMMGSWPRRRTDVLVSGRCSDRLAGQSVDPSAHNCGTDSSTDRGAYPLGTSSFSHHIGWPQGDVPLPYTNTAAEACSLVNEFHKAANVAVAAIVSKTQMWGACVEKDDDPVKDKMELEDEEVDAEEDDDIDSLLRPGGSPCLPMENGWALSWAAQQIAASGAADDAEGGVTSCIRGGKEVFDTACTSNDTCNQLQQRNRQHLKLSPLRPLSRHRACQLGYTDSAPAHSTARVGDIKVEFLREPKAAARWQVMGGTLSAPPGATGAHAAAAAVAAPKPGTAASALLKTGIAVEASSELEDAVLQPLVLGKTIPLGAREAMMPGTFARQPAAGFGFDFGYGAVAAAPPAGAAQSPASHWNRTIAASVTAVALPPPLADLQEMVDSSSCSPSLEMESSFTNANVCDPDPNPDPSSGFFGASLADGLASLLKGLAAGGASSVTSAGASGSMLRQHEFFLQRAGEQVQKRSDGTAVLSVTPGPAGRFGCGLLTCFTGHGHRH